MSIEKAFVGNLKDIKKTVVISPVFYPNKFGLKGEKTPVGNIVAHDKLFSYIKTYPGSQWVFDTILCLKKTKAKDIIFIGTAGSISSKYKIGDIVFAPAYPDPSYKEDDEWGVVSVFSFNSLLHETKEKLKKITPPALPLCKGGMKGRYDVVDLETSSFHEACKNIARTGFVFLLIQDEPLSKPFYKPLSPKDADRLQDGIEKLIRACRIAIKSLQSL
jgi:hypothetical protein